MNKGNLPYARSIAPNRYVTRSLQLVEPDRTLCRLCGLIRLRYGDVCPPEIRSEWEDEVIRREQLARRSA